jgi:hypothetical protein
MGPAPVGGVILAPVHTEMVSWRSKGLKMAPETDVVWLAGGRLDGQSIRVRQPGQMPCGKARFAIEPSLIGIARPRVAASRQPCQSSSLA